MIMLIGMPTAQNTLSQNYQKSLKFACRAFSNGSSANGSTVEVGVVAGLTTGAAAGAPATAAAAGGSAFTIG